MEVSENQYPVRPLRTFILCCALSLATTAFSQEKPAENLSRGEPTTASSAIAAPVKASGAAINSGDLVEIAVYGVPELSQKTRVTSAGEIYLPLIGHVHLEGLTIEQAQALIEKRLVDGGFIRNPHVTLFTAEYASGVSVLGEVARPGVYPIIGSRRLFDVISAAGGFTPAAGREISIIHRENPNQRTTVVVSSDPNKTAQSNIEIQQADTVVVSKGPVVYVVGEVVKPSGFVLDPEQTFTVLKAVAMADGPTRGASLNAAKIIRKMPNGLQEIPIPLKKLMQGKIADIALMADDVVYIPGGSSGKGAAKRGLEAIVQVTTGLAIYAPK